MYKQIYKRNSILFKLVFVTLNNMYLGIDGFKNGWCCCIINTDISIELFSNFQDLVKKFNSVKSIFIDIPIGLSSSNIERTIDSSIRKLLPKNKKSSVFTPPCRESLKMKDHFNANKVNKQILGKGISIQAWNIGYKINEVDNLLTTNLSLSNIVHESHPELCFCYINNYQSLNFNKKTAEGFQERVDIIEKYFPNINELIESNFEENKKEKIKRDDLLDAIILAISARDWKRNGSRIIRQKENNDVMNIPFGIYY